MKDLYAILGVGRNASEKQIIAAYRRLAAKKHPDIKGGSKEAFEEIKLARDVLVDPTRRARYDTTGEYVNEPPDQTRPKALGVITQAFVQTLSALEQARQLPKHHDLARMVVDNIRSQVDRSAQAREAMQAKLTELDDVIRRFGQDGVLKAILTARVAEMRASMTMAEAGHQVLELALEIASKETYAWEAAPAVVVPMAVVINRVA